MVFDLHNPLNALHRINLEPCDYGGMEALPLWPHRNRSIREIYPSSHHFGMNCPLRGDVSATN
jgi:hypothetical protein